MPKNDIYVLGCTYGNDIQEGASKSLTKYELYPMTMDNIYRGDDAEFLAEILPKIANKSGCSPPPKAANVYICSPRQILQFSENMDQFERGIKDSFDDPKKCKNAAVLAKKG